MKKNIAKIRLILSVLIFTVLITACIEKEKAIVNRKMPGGSVPEELHVLNIKNRTTSDIYYTLNTS